MATIPEALAIAIQHHQGGHLQAAEQIYRKILAVEPDHADALHLLGVIAGQVGNHAAAVQYISRAIRLKGHAAAFHNNLGNALRAQGKLDEAVAAYRRALQLQPRDAEAHNNLGNALKDQGKLDEAVACCRRALELQPDSAEAHNNLGLVLKDQGKLEEAVACCRRALQLKPEFAEAHNNLGLVLVDQGKLDEAAACYRRALELKPDSAEAHSNLGNVLREQGKLDEAMACYHRALELKPDSAEAHNNLGLVLMDQGKLDEAVACCQRALELKPDYAEAHNSVGNILTDQGKLDEAVACCQSALELKPELAAAHWNRSLLRLLSGNFADGWPEYEWRWRMKDWRPRCFPQMSWDGQPLPGKSILLHAEQGLGDTIQFIRYAALVGQCGARVVVECQKPLVRLLAACPGIDQLLAAGEELPGFDVHAPLMSLPLLCKTTLENIPASIPYVFAAPALVAQWRERLDKIDGLKVGICWQGNPQYRGDRYRSIPLRHFADLARLPGICLISLQKGAGREQLAAVRDDFPVVDWADELDEAAGPFMDTAAIIQNLDLVITSDTVIAHLAGAMGVPVWVGLPLVPDWPLRANNE
jgi:tetratricopeptide (TPR) repeat protein